MGSCDLHQTSCVWGLDLVEQRNLSMKEGRVVVLLGQGREESDVIIFFFYISFK